jgi:hypothetical protein
VSSLDDKNPLPSKKMTAIQNDLNMNLNPSMNLNFNTHNGTHTKCPTTGDNSTGNDNTNKSISTIGVDSGMNKQLGGPAALSYDFGTVLDLNSLWHKELSGGNN